MNKYLLLRDNKQSGPYTVPEIIEIGIKPYDLVWLEGKSAAWRYPSEVEELKAYAPAVEEQPFDRFYKTREAVSGQDVKEKEEKKESVLEVSEHSPYVPKISEEVTIGQDLPRKKVYINFPASAKPAAKVPAAVPVQEFSPKQTPVKEVAAASTFTQYNVPFDRPSERWSPHTAAGTKAQEKKYIVYAAATACIILLGFVAVLMINNSGQKKRLQELNTIVKDIQSKNNTASIIPASQMETVQQEQTAGETIINPELLKLSEAETPAPAETKRVEPPAAVKPEPAKSTAELAVRTESTDGGRPVLRRSDNNKVTPSTTADNSDDSADSPRENLFKEVNIQPGRYKVGMLGGISNFTLALTNNSKRELHKVVVQVNYLGPEKKVVNTQTVYFENVAPGGQSTIEVPKSKRGVAIDYTITDIKS